jgi:hypothetical protein
MTLQSSGPISASDIWTEFNMPNGTPMSQWYAGGPYVPSGTVGDNGPVPTSGTISFSDFYGASRTNVDVLGGLFIDVDPTSAIAGYRLNTNGQEQSREGGGYVAFNNWLLFGSPFEFDCRFTVNSGDTPTGSSVNTWLNLANLQFWELATSGVLKTTDGTIEVRDAGTLAVLDTASVNLRAEISI